VVALTIGIVIGIIVCFVALAAIGAALDAKESPDPEAIVHLHALRRRRELDDYKRETKAAARRLRYELRQELRLLDDEE
jgi:hypothetical protein